MRFRARDRAFGPEGRGPSVFGQLAEHLSRARQVSREIAGSTDIPAWRHTTGLKHNKTKQDDPDVCCVRIMNRPW